MKPLTLVVPPLYSGDTWPGFTVNSVLINGSAPTSPAVSAKLQFRTKTGKLGFEYVSEDTDCKGRITITDANNWGMKIEPHVITLKKGIWWWDLEVTAEDGTVATIFKGRLKGTRDITVP